MAKDDDSPKLIQGMTQEQFTKYIFNGMDDPSINMVFSNRMAALIQDSDVLMYFGVESPRGGDDHPELNNIKYSTCVGMSHAYFMDCMRYLAARFNALEELYEHPITATGVSRVDPERFKAAMDKMNHIPDSLGGMKDESSS